MANSAGKGKAGLIPSSSDELPSEPTLDRAVQERIGDSLRAMYDDLMQQPVPDRFAALLDRLEKTNDKGN
jgi:hypothetical protein